MCGAAVVTGRTRGIGAATAIAQKDWGKIDDAGFITGPTMSANGGQHRN